MMKNHFVTTADHDDDKNLLGSAILNIHTFSSPNFYYTKRANLLLDAEIKNLAAFISEADRSVDEILQQVRHQQLILNITADYKYYLLFCAIFTGERNVIKHWPKYEPAFLSLVAQDGEVGIKRLLQTIGLYFVIREPDQQKYLDTFMKLLYDQAVFSD